jgi:NADH:ubiquinone oxidoreductase subunit
MNIQIYIWTWFRGKLVGEDSLGNCYYQDRWSKRYGRPRRWVIYKGEIEPSRIPPQWQAWIHNSVEEAPITYEPHRWEKTHVQNLTGTADAYKPKGKRLSGRSIQKNIHESWKPKT